MKQGAAGQFWNSAWILRWILLLSVVIAVACGDTNLEEFGPSGDAGTPFEPSVTNDALQTTLPPTRPATTTAPTATTAPPPTPPPTTAPPPPGAAETVHNDIEGNAYALTWSEPGRPIYGWRDDINVWYCSDDTLAFEASGQRRTVLDNTEYRSSSERGSWRVSGNGSIVAIEHANNFGVFFTFWIDVGPNGFILDDGWTATLLGPADC